MDDRKLEVLRAIVEDYVATREPVGSKVLAERHNFGVSSATLRNDMAVLEEEGYIVAPTPAPGESPRTRVTGCSSTALRRSSRCPRPNAVRSTSSWTVRSISTTSCNAPCGFWHN